MNGQKIRIHVSEQDNVRSPGEIRSLTRASCHNAQVWFERNGAPVEFAPGEELQPGDIIVIQEGGENEQIQA